MSETTHAGPGPEMATENATETPEERIARLTPVMGVENARRLVASRVSEDQRRRLAQLVTVAPRRVPSDAPGSD